MNVTASNYFSPWNNSDVSHRPTLFLNDIQTENGVVGGMDSLYKNWVFEGRPSSLIDASYGTFVIFGFNVETRAVASFTGTKLSTLVMAK